MLGRFLTFVAVALTGCAQQNDALVRDAVTNDVDHEPVAPGVTVEMNESEDDGDRMSHRQHAPPPARLQHNDPKDEDSIAVEDPNEWDPLAPL